MLGSWCVLTWRPTTASRCSWGSTTWVRQSFLTDSLLGFYVNLSFHKHQQSKAWSRNTAKWHACFTRIHTPKTQTFWKPRWPGPQTDGCGHNMQSVVPHESHGCCPTGNSSDRVQEAPLNRVHDVDCTTTVSGVGLPYCIGNPTFSAWRQLDLFVFSP